MWTDDDVLTPTRWRRLQARVAGVDLDVLLKWSLLAMSVMMGVSFALGTLAFLWSLGAQAVGLIAGWL